MPDFGLEDEARRQGHVVIAGVDEAGRGPLAGPVVAAAVILDPDTLSPALRLGLDDSKKLAASVREALFERLAQEAILGVGEAGVEEIDSLNILQATMQAMTRAVKALGRRPDLALVDGNRAPILDCRVRCVVGGDGKSLSIAAASIVAKVSRDRMMADLARRHPGYGWERNAGYGTAEHLAALGRLGVTPAHRRSYAPVRNMLRPGSP